MSNENDPPPPYELESMIVDAYDQFEKKLKEDPVAANKALAEALGGAASSEAFVKDMEGLRLNISCLNTLFGKVEEGLATVDAEKLHDEEGKIVEWQPKWKVIRAFYTKTMLASRDLATRIANRVETFFKIVLPKLKQDLSPKQKEEMLTWFVGEKVDATSYNEALKKDENDAEQMYKDFLQVQTDVSTFKSQFNTWFKQAEEQLKKEITDLQGEVSKIKADLEVLTTKRNVSIGVAAVGGTAAIGAGAVMIATGVLAPLGVLVAVVGALAALGGGIAAAVLQSKIADKQAELNSKQAELDIKLAKQERLNTILKPLVATLNADMDDIRTRLKTMMDIWSFIKSQAQTARLEVQKSIDSEAPSFLKDDLIDASCKAYKVLYTCVKMYGEGFEKKVEK